MSIENPFENGPRPPQFEEVQAKIERFIGHKNFEVVRTLWDDEGVYLHEVRIPTKWGSTIYAFRREKAGENPGAGRSQIEKIDLDATGQVDFADQISVYNPATKTWRDF